MSSYAQWDAVERVIFVDLSGAELGARDVDQVCEDILREARRRAPERPFVLVDWTGGRFLPDGAKRFDERVAGLYEGVRAIVRYGVDDILTRVGLRTDTLKLRLQDLKTHLYETRADALSAIRQFEASVDEP